MKEINMLWVNQEHPEFWGGQLVSLREHYGFKVEMMTFIEDENVLNNCKGKDAVVIHCGTQKPMAEIKDLLQNIKNKYPNIKIGLETNAEHPDLEDVTDFCVYKPISAEELQLILRESIK